MRILVVNSNATAAVTDRIAAAARAVASAGTVIDAISAPFGLPLIVTRADWLVAGPATLAALSSQRGRAVRLTGQMLRHPRPHRARALTGFAPEAAGLYAARWHPAPAARYHHTSRGGFRRSGRVGTTLVVRS